MADGYRDHQALVEAHPFDGHRAMLECTSVLAPHVMMCHSDLEGPPRQGTTKASRSRRFANIDTIISNTQGHRRMLYPTRLNFSNFTAGEWKYLPHMQAYLHDIRTTLPPSTPQPSFSPPQLQALSQHQPHRDRISSSCPLFLGRAPSYRPTRSLY